MSVLVKPHGGGDSGGNKGNTNSFDSCLLVLAVVGIVKKKY